MKVTDYKSLKAHADLISQDTSECLECEYNGVTIHVYESDYSPNDWGDRVFMVAAWEDYTGDEEYGEIDTDNLEKAVTLYLSDLRYEFKEAFCE